MTRNGPEGSRGIVVVIRAEGGYCYALAQDGRYLKLKVEGRTPEAGEIVELPTGAVALNPASAGRSPWRAVATYALAAMAVLAIGIGLVAAALRTQPSACVAIEINPAVELGLNSAGLVVTARGTDPEGEAVVEASHDAVMYHPAPDAVAAVVKAAGDLGYLHTDRENVVQVSVVAPDSYPHVEQGIQERTAALLEARGFFGYLKVRRAVTDVLDSARKDGMSVNAYLLKKELKARGIEMGSWGRSVGEILGRVGPERAFGEDDLIGGRRKKGAPDDDRPAQGGGDGRGAAGRENRGRDTEQPNRNGGGENPGREPTRNGESGLDRGIPGSSLSGNGPRVGEAGAGGGRTRTGESADTRQTPDDAGLQPTPPPANEQSKAGGATRETTTKPRSRKKR